MSAPLATEQQTTSTRTRRRCGSPTTNSSSTVRNPTDIHTVGVLNEILLRVRAAGAFSRWSWISRPVPAQDPDPPGTTPNPRPSEAHLVTEPAPAASVPAPELLRLSLPRAALATLSAGACWPASSRRAKLLNSRTGPAPCRSMKKCWPPRETGGHPGHHFRRPRRHRQHAADHQLVAPRTTPAARTGHRHNLLQHTWR